MRPAARLSGLLLCMACLLLAACAGKRPAPVVEDRNGGRSAADATAREHVVATGDTLYSIALRYDRDYRDLARWNGINPSTYLIRPGQRLRLSGPPAPPVAAVSSVSAASRPPAVAPPASSSPPAARAPQASAPATPAGQATVAKSLPSVSSSSVPTSAPARASSGLAWGWPAKGALLSRFGSPGLPGKGVDIAGRRGDSVLAAADGTVVYAGTGLVGYGKLLIVRHDDNYISAYAHNDRFLVGEGDRVTLGQPIAQIGATGTDRERLHFEIREGGKPVDPLRFLPGRD